MKLHQHQNPHSIAPAHIIEAQRILTVLHYDFDDIVRGGEIVVHEGVSDDVSDFFKLAYELRFPIEKIVPICNERYRWEDELSMADNNTTGFNYRTIMGTDQLSAHASGRAFDVNPRQNIYVRYDEKERIIACYPNGATYDEHARGTLTKDHELVRFMKKRGWIWGGDWEPSSGRVDYQHFEKP